MSEIGFTRADIRLVIDPFYAAVRQDATLGPIFNGQIGESDAEWGPHLDKIENFWANVLLKKRSYSGNPMMVHQQVPGIKPEHFTRWLELFGEAACTALPAEKAFVISETATRIGRSLAMGLSRAAGGPPVLVG
ncbi:MAG: group III truncated hemoglobin [Pikeienuella sp.]